MELVAAKDKMELLKRGEAKQVSQQIREKIEQLEAQQEQKGEELAKTKRNSLEALWSRYINDTCEKTDVLFKNKASHKNDRSLYNNYLKPIRRAMAKKVLSNQTKKHALAQLFQLLKHSNR